MRSIIRGKSGRSFFIRLSGEWVERDYSGPARVSGSAGTGKTIVALHRAVFLARANPDSQGVADHVLRHLGECATHQAAAVDQQRAASCGTSGSACDERYRRDGSMQQHFGHPKIASPEVIRRIHDGGRRSVSVTRSSASLSCSRSGTISLMLGSWRRWEAYRDVTRLGRKTRLPESQRAEAMGGS